MATAFKRLMDSAKIRLPGALDDVIRHELFETCLEFFRRSDTWRDNIEFLLPANVRGALLTPMAGRIQRLVSVSAGPLTLDNRRDVRGATLDGNTLVMPFAPANNEVYVAHLSMTVSDPVTRDAYPIIPAELVERFHEVLLDGLLMKVMSQPNKPYTNVSLATYHARRFTSGSSRARNEINTGNTVGSQRWAFPQTFNRRS